MSEAIEGEIVSQTTPVRLTKFDEEVVKRLEAAFNNGFNITEACQYADITRTTYYDWLEKDDIFSYRMSVAQAAPNRVAKTMIIQAIQRGDANLALRYLTLRDPDFKPKLGIEPSKDLQETREKIKEFLDDDSADDASEQPTATDSPEAGSEVAPAPTDIS